MNNFQDGDSLSVNNFLVLLPSFVILYFGLLLFYRFFVSPVAKFPGPRLAALTYLYEFYFDVWREGQYTWKLRNLHTKYGTCLD